MYNPDTPRVLVQHDPCTYESLHNYAPQRLTKGRFLDFYADIQQFRSLFDLPIETINQVDLKQHCKLLNEEMRELIAAETRVDKIDGMVDSFYVIMGHIVNAGLSYEGLLVYNPVVINLMDTLLQAADDLNFSFQEAWDIVHASNLSKLCTDENLHETISFYKYNGIPTTYTDVGCDPNNESSRIYAVKVKQDCNDVEGKELPAGKVLKSVDYTPADLSGL